MKNYWTHLTQDEKRQILEKEGLYFQESNNVAAMLETYTRNMLESLYRAMKKIREGKN